MEMKTRLHSTKNGSNKEYVTHLKPQGDGWVLHCANGKFGASLTPQIKIAEPVAYEVAKKQFDKVVNSKLKGGYVIIEADEGAALVGAEIEARQTGYEPILPVAITHEEMRKLVAANPSDWIAQEKMNGHHRGVIIKDGVATGTNKQGMSTPLRQAEIDAVEKLSGIGLKDVILSAEHVEGYLAVFDIHQIDGENVRGEGFGLRAKRLDRFHAATRAADVEFTLYVIPTFEFENIAAFDKVVAEAEEKAVEGLVFKHRSGAECYKLKFRADCTARVKAHTTGKRSVELELLDANGQWVDCGKVTIPANADIPAVGALVDVQYLHASGAGKLIEPVFERVRTDYSEAECRVDRLKFQGQSAKKAA